MKRVGYDEAAAHLGMPGKVSTLRSMVSRRLVPHYRISPQRVVFDLDELDRWLADRHVEVARTENTRDEHPVITLDVGADRGRR